MIAMTETTQTAKCPVVSVIVTTKNRAPLLREALDSVDRARSEHYELDVIVVDDGSTDDTANVVAGYRVKVIRTDGVGMARARNLGLEAATGDFVTFLDDDDVWLPGNIASQLDEFERHPEYAAVHGQSQLMQFDGTPYGAPVPNGPLPSGQIFESLLSYMPQVATVLTRTWAAHEAGGMDVTLNGDTDWDWLLRIAWRHQIGRIDRAVMLFRQREKMDLELSWRRYLATICVFRRHARKLPLATRIKAVRTELKHRGQWCSSFFNSALGSWRCGNRAHAVRAFFCAAASSPLHLAVCCGRAMRRHMSQVHGAINSAN
jgi:glycosyltransferase involved in cell wall biosynthesis